MLWAPQTHTDLQTGESLVQQMYWRACETDRGPVFWIKKKNYRCPLCSEALSPAWRLNCNEVFCRNCIGARLMHGHRDCPICQAPIKLILVDEIIDSIHRNPWGSDFINFYWQTIDQSAQIRSGKINCIRNFEIEAWLRNEKHRLKPINSWRNLLNKTKPGLVLCLWAVLYARFAGGIRSAITWGLLTGGTGIAIYNYLRIRYLRVRLLS